MDNCAKKVIVAMSGGVDSSVSACLLKEAGFDVAGIFMKCWSEEEIRTGVCTAEEDEKWARRAAAKIGIPFYSVDLVKEYRKKVVDYFVEEYRNGRTPNPDVMCNREIKFGVFYDWALNNFGADYIATGHYARIGWVFPSGSFSAAPCFTKATQGTQLIGLKSMLCPSVVRKGEGGPNQPSNPPEGNTKPILGLYKGVDSDKDQSYFLWAVTGEKFGKVIFPVGGYLKSEVRDLARKFGLPNSERKDSQGICFIGAVNVADFLREFIPNKPGAIMNAKKEVVGKHEGLHYYTIGQRKRINIGGGPPYYVWSKDYETNTLLVSREFDDELFGKDLICSNINWISAQPDLYREGFECSAKIRYRQEDQDAIIKNIRLDGSLAVGFNVPQRAVTPGQSIVFYKGEELIGGGVIKYISINQQNKRTIKQV